MKIYCLFLCYFWFGFQTLQAQTPVAANPLSRFEFTEPRMGTEFRILMYAADASQAGAAAREAFDKIAFLDSLMSDYREDSEISRLGEIPSESKVKTPVSDELWRVLSFAQDVSKRSDGAFDITAGPLTKIWRRAFRQKNFPDPQEIKVALESTGYKNLEVNKNKTVRFKKPGMRLDLGGVAKGFAVDEAMKIIQAHGLTIALVDGGGDMLAGDGPPGTMGWLIEKPVMTDDGPGIEKVVLKNAAIATSGATYQFLEHEGKRYSHIVDPRTGLGVTSSQLITVTAPTCMEADAWATAMSVEVNTDAFLWLQKQGIKVEISLY